MILDRLRNIKTGKLIEISDDALSLEQISFIKQKADEAAKRLKDMFDDREANNK